MATTPGRHQTTTPQTMPTATATLNVQALAISAASQLHERMLNDDAFLGYTGTLEEFERLMRECHYIAREEVSLEVEPVTQIVDQFYNNQFSIMAGELDCVYWMY